MISGRPGSFSSRGGLPLMFSANRVGGAMKLTPSAKSPILIRPTLRALILDGVIRVGLLALLSFGLFSIYGKVNIFVIFPILLSITLLIVMPFVVTIVLVVKEKREGR